PVAICPAVRAHAPDSAVTITRAAVIGNASANVSSSSTPFRLSIGLSVTALQDDYRRTFCRRPFGREIEILAGKLLTVDGLIRLRKVRPYLVFPECEAVVFRDPFWCKAQVRDNKSYTSLPQQLAQLGHR